MTSAYPPNGLWKFFYWMNSVNNLSKNLFLSFVSLSSNLNISFIYCKLVSVA